MQGEEDVSLRLPAAGWFNMTGWDKGFSGSKRNLINSI
jgi:hypothetical protein